jgi:hypothetical protein
MTRLLACDVNRILAICQHAQEAGAQLKNHPDLSSTDLRSRMAVRWMELTAHFKGKPEAEKLVPATLRQEFGKLPKGL